MKTLFAFFISVLCAVGSMAQNDMNLHGEWQFRMDSNGVGEAEGWYNAGFRFDETITLPASMPERLKGYKLNVNTQWMGGLYDSSYYHNPYMAKYRIEENFKVPFFLTPARHYVGRAWYKRSVNIGKLKYADGTSVVYRLYLERPHIATSVWVNGVRVESSDLKPSATAMTANSLSVPHVYFFSEKNGLRMGENTIAICVDNRHEAAKVGQDSHSITDQTQGDWNGIVGKIELSEQGLMKSVKVFPDVDNRKAVVRIALNSVNTKKPETATIRLKAESRGNDAKHIVESKPVEVKLTAEEQTIEVELLMGDGMKLWDEFTPELYDLNVEVATKQRISREQTIFGMRKIEVRGKDFLVNGKVTQLRGTVENCCFPNTGYPPTDLDSWLRIFRTCKEWGLNHVRFHSYCPPEAAFLAADMVGFYIQPEGPSWPNHGVKLGRGEYIDTYLYDEAVRIMDTYGNHPSFAFFAFGNEPAGDWVKWSNIHTPRIAEYDPRHINCGFSVGGGWAWQPKVEYAVKAGARGLDSWKNHAPESTLNFYEKVHTYNGKDMPGTPITIPFVSHETGQWCVFPNLKETGKYKGVNKAGNFEIFRDLLNDNGMGSMAEKFLYASGKLQSLCYKYELERHLRTPDYSGFQLLGLNDYSGQGSAIVGVTDVFWEDKGYIKPEEWREFCSEIVPLARIGKFTYSNTENFKADVELSQYSGKTLTDVKPQWSIVSNGEVFASGEFATCTVPQGQNNELGSVSVPLSSVRKAGKYTFTVTVPGTTARNHWDFWVYPEVVNDDMADVYVTDSLDAKAVKMLKKGGKVLICAAGKVSYGREVKQQFTPVFWNTSWFKMRPPHTTGIYVENTHPVFNEFPTDYHSDLQWWELVNNAQVMQFTDFPRDFQPLVQSIDTWFVSRKIGMLFEANVKIGNSRKTGKLMMTTMDLNSNLDKRLAARQMRHSIMEYMKSDKFNPAWSIDEARIAELFTKVAGEVNMYTNDSPDELKPKLK